MKKILCLFLFLGITFLCSAQAGKVSSECEKLILDFFQLRMEISVFDQVEESDKAFERIDCFREEYSSVFDKLPDDEKLAVENFYINEYYNFLYLNPEKKNQCRTMLKVQFEKNEKFCKDKTDEELNKWLLVTYGDVTSCSMAFSMKDVMKYGMTVKPLYERALALDPDFSYGNLNIGQWYFWAPGMAGGSKKKAVSFVKTAVDNAGTDAEKYFTNLLYSQLLFEVKDKKDASDALEICKQLCPESKVVKTCIEQNAKGKSLFEYNKELSDLSKDEK